MRRYRDYMNRWHEADNPELIATPRKAGSQSISTDHNARDNSSMGHACDRISTGTACGLSLVHLAKLAMLTALARRSHSDEEVNKASPRLSQQLTLPGTACLACSEAWEVAPSRATTAATLSASWTRRTQRRAIRSSCLRQRWIAWASLYLRFSHTCIAFCAPQNAQSFYAAFWLDRLSSERQSLWPAHFALCCS